MTLQTITVKPGWNAFSLSVELGTPLSARTLIALASIQGVQLDSVARTQLGRWQVTTVGTPSDFSLNTKAGYLLFASSGGSFNILGTGAPQIRTLERIDRGVSLVGYAATGDATNAATLVDDLVGLKGCSPYRVARWTDAGWRYWSATSPTGPFALVAGEAYLLEDRRGCLGGDSR